MQETKNNKIIVIYGATASGKSLLAEKIKEKFKNIAIINSDALQIYKGLEILSASPKQQEDYFLYNFQEGHKYYSAAKWINDSISIINLSRKKNIIPVIIGGTAMYQNCLINGMREIKDTQESIKKETNILVEKYGIEYLYNELINIDKETINLLHKNDKNRIIRNYNIFKSLNITPSQYNNIPNKIFYSKEDFVKITLLRDRTKLYNFAEKRFEKMIHGGAIEEVEKQKNNGIKLTDPIAKTIGFKELYHYLEGKLNLNEAINMAKQETRHYIKRQNTWINNNIDPELNEIKSDNETDIIKQLEKIL
ncbi:MAG: tRNA (adenosine(37)-N6)-dimethylallyltransferase MiaA [Rickettsiales bacterium]|nr:tRNA (adenosine(37)-N6)-dimethylallyltransferase MiaA [Rickettsiales bacterium]